MQAQRILAVLIALTTSVLGQPTGTSVAGSSVRAYVTDFGGGTVSVVDLEAGRTVAQIKTGTKPHGVAIAPDGSAVYVSNEGDGTVSFIDPRENAVTATVEVGKFPNQLAVSAMASTCSSRSMALTGWRWWTSLPANWSRPWEWARTHILPCSAPTGRPSMSLWRASRKW